MIGQERRQTQDQAIALVKSRKEEARQSLVESVEDFERILADEHYRYLWKFREIEQELEQLESVPVALAPAVPTYIIGSLFLAQCRAMLTTDDKENMFYVSGVEGGGCIYLTDHLTFECSSRSAGGVHGDDESVFQAMMKLTRADHRLYAWFHSHQGSRDACAPSGTDMAMQKRLESVKYPAIGGIFTRDGYLRFFSVERKFQIQIHGQGVKHVEPEKFLFKIELPD